MPDDDPETPLDQILFLARAESRVRILECLLSSGAASQRELRAELDASRTTVSRSLRSLEDREWVVHEEDGYRLTRVGQIVASEFVDTLETVRTAEQRSAFLRWFPADVSAPDFLEDADAEITVPTDGDPYAPARTQAEILRDVDALRILLPSIDLEATKLLAEQVTQRGLEVETVVPPTLEETMASGEFAPLIRETMETGRSTMFVADRELPFYLGLAGDGRVQVGVGDEEGFPRALLETTEAACREWAEGVYREYRAGAREKPLAEF